MKFLEKYFKVNISIMTIIISLELFIILTWSHYRAADWTVDWVRDSAIFNNIATPITTLVAVIVYYLTLQHIKAQSASMKEDIEIAKGESYYSDLNNKILVLKKKLDEIDFGILSEITSREEKVKIPFSRIHETAHKFKHFECIVIDTDDGIKKITDFLVSMNELLKRIEIIKSEVDSHEILHPYQKKQLHNLIINDLLVSYLWFMIIMDLNNEFETSPLKCFKQGYSEKFLKLIKYYEIERMLIWVQKDFPTLFKTVLQECDFEINEETRKEVKKYQSRLILHN